MTRRRERTRGRAKRAGFRGRLRSLIRTRGQPHPEIRQVDSATFFVSGSKVPGPAVLGYPDRARLPHEYGQRQTRRNLFIVRHIRLEDGHPTPCSGAPRVLPAWTLPFHSRGEVLDLRRFNSFNRPFEPDT